MPARGVHGWMGGVFILFCLIGGVFATTCNPQTVVPRTTSGTISVTNIAVNQHCLWFLEVTGNPRIKFTVSSLNVGSGTTGCPSTYVNIFDGNSTSCQAMARLCGNTYCGPPLVSSGTTAVVEIANGGPGTISLTIAWAGTTNTPSRSCVGFTDLTSQTSGYIADPIPFVGQANGVVLYRSCSWLLKGGSHVLADVPPIYLDGEKVYFYDGMNASAPLIVAWDDGTDPAVLRSTGQYMFVAVGNAGQVYGTGFNISFTSIAGPEQCSTSGASCLYQEFSIASGHVETPWPYISNTPYLPRLNCEFGIYTYLAPTINRLNLTILSMNIDTGDSLRICGGDDGVHIATLSGRKNATSYIINGDNAQLYFLTDNINGGGTGFAAIYSGFYVPSMQCQAIGTFGNPTDGTGMIGNPIPNDGNTKMAMSAGNSCVWTLYGPNRVQVVSGTDVDIGASANGCTNSAIEVFDGPNTTSPILGRFCEVVQSNEAATYRSSGKYLTIRLTAYVATSGRNGFQMTVTNTSAAGSIGRCVGQAIQGGATRGNIASVYPYGSATYDNDMNCTWPLDAGLYGRIYLQIRAYKIAGSESSGANATHDRVRVYNSYTVTSSPIYLCCSAMNWLSSGRFATIQWWTSPGGVGNNMYGFNATWSINVCPDLSAMTGRNFSRNTTHLIVTCQSGFNATGGAVLSTCALDNTWQPAPASCTSSSIPVCTRPTIPNGSCGDPASSVVAGDNATCSCNQGYALSGNGTLHCQATGSFKEIPPTCTLVTCTVPALGANLTCDTPTGGTVTAGSAVTCSCGGGLAGAGGAAGVMTCLTNATFDYAPMNCVVPCSIRTNPFNGVCVPGAPRKLYVGQTTNCSCSAGYILQGEETPECVGFESWSDPQPTCAPTCTVPAPPSDATCDSSAGTALLVGQMLTCNCANHFVAAAGSVTTRTCMALQTFDNPPLQCVKPCTVRADPAHGSCDPPVAGATSLLVGEYMSCSCATGYTLVGNDAPQCTGLETWSDPQPTCAAPCLVAQPVDHVVCSVAPGGSVIVGANVSCACTGGFVSSVGANAEEILICMVNGSFVGDAPSCRYPCAVRTAPDNGYCTLPTAGITGLLVGESVVCGCNPGYRIQGATNPSCTATDTWSDPQPTCAVDVALLATPVPTIDSVTPALLPLAGGVVKIFGAHWTLPLVRVTVAGVDLSLDNVTTRDIHGGGGAQGVVTARRLAQSADTSSSNSASFSVAATSASGYIAIEITDSSGRVALLPSTLFATDDCPTEGEYGRGRDCKPCPEGATCPGGYRVWPLPGYWNSGEASGYVSPCPEVATRCAGGKDSACAPHYQGLLCADCAPGYYSRGTDCAECPAPQSQLILYLVNGAVFLALAIAFIVLSDEPLNVVVTIFKLLQVLRMAGEQSGAHLPEAIKTINDYLSLVTFDYNFVKPTCGATASASSDSTFETVFWGNAVVILCLVGPPVVALLILRVVHPKRRDFYTNRLYRAVTIYLTLLYFVVDTRIFQSIACVHVGEKWVLKAQPTIECSASPIYVVGWIGALVFTAGTPFAFLYFLLRLHKRNLLQEPTHQARYGYMYDGLRMDKYCFLYGVLPFFHMCLVALAWTVFPVGAAPYVVALTSFSLIIVSTVVWRPYTEWYNTGILIASFGVGLLSTLANLLTLSTATKAPGTTAAVLVVVALAIVGMAVGTMVYERTRAKRSGKVAPLVGVGEIELKASETSMASLDPLLLPASKTEVDDVHERDEEKPSRGDDADDDVLHGSGVEGDGHELLASAPVEDDD